MRVGVIFRCFSKSYDGVANQITELMEGIDRILSLRSDLPPLAKINVAIPVGDMFVDTDCGETWKALIRALADKSLLNLVDVQETVLGILSGAVNATVAQQLSRGCTHSLIISTTCNSMITEKNLAAMFRAFDSGAKVAGLTLPDPVMEELVLAGCITNTFAMWELVPLISVGGFVMWQENRFKNERYNHYVQGANGDYPISGLEIPTLGELRRYYGQCIAPIMAPDQGDWKMPDKDKEPQKCLRELDKRNSKWPRHHATAALGGFDLSYIRTGILPGYPK